MYTFEDWTNHRMIDPSHFDEEYQDIISFHDILLHNEWVQRLIQNGYLSKEEYGRIRSSQKELLTFYEKLHWIRIVSKIKSELQSAPDRDELLDFKKSNLIKYNNEFKTNEKVICEWVLTGMDISYKVDPELYWHLKSVKEGVIKFAQIPNFVDPNTPEFTGDDGIIGDVRKERKMLQKYIEYKYSRELLNYLESELQNANKIELRGRSETKIIMGDDFFKKAKELGKNKFAFTKKKNPSDWLVNQLLGKYEGFKKEDVKKTKGILPSASTIKRVLKENRDKWAP